MMATQWCIRVCGWGHTARGAAGLGCSFSRRVMCVVGVWIVLAPATRVVEVDACAERRRERRRGSAPSAIIGG
jgi:hypothetical protein